MNQELNHPGGPILEYSEGRELEPLPCGTPDPELPLNPSKGRKRWSEMFSMRYAEIIEIKPHEEKDFLIELTGPSVVFIKVSANSVGRGLLSAQLYQEGRQRPVWVTEASMLRESWGHIKDQVEITEDMIADGKRWTIKLLNSSDQPLSAEVLIGTVDLAKAPE